MTDPIGDQVAAHEAYLQLSAEADALEADGDHAGARNKHREAEAAKRRWHKLARLSDVVMRNTRAQP